MSILEGAFVIGLVEGAVLSFAFAIHKILDGWELRRALKVRIQLAEELLKLERQAPDFDRLVFEAMKRPSRKAKRGKAAIH